MCLFECKIETKRKKMRMCNLLLVLDNWITGQFRDLVKWVYSCIYIIINYHTITCTNSHTHCTFIVCVFAPHRAIRQWISLRIESVLCDTKYISMANKINCNWQCDERRRRVLRSVTLCSVYLGHRQMEKKELTTKYLRPLVCAFFAIILLIYSSLARLVISFSRILERRHNTQNNKSKISEK